MNNLDLMSLRQWLFLMLFIKPLPAIKEIINRFLAYKTTRISQLQQNNDHIPLIKFNTVLPQGHITAKLTQTSLLISY